MQRRTKDIIGASIVLVTVVGTFLLLAYFMGKASEAFAADEVPAVVREMQKDIKDAQIFVQTHEPQVNAAKQKAQVYRNTICETHKEFCKAEYLDPLGAGIDLSPYLH